MAQLGLSAEEIALLGSPGWFTRASFLGDELALCARREAEALLSAGSLHRAGVRRGADHHLDEAVRGDSITWLDEGASPVLRSVFEHFEALRQAVNEAAWLGLRRFELQLAHYPGTGAGYQRHRDAFPGDDNRRLTAICYLNPHWSAAHGGQLRLCCEPAVELEPRLDRLVVFRSELIEHEVRPSLADRFALTAWYSAR